MIHNSVQQDFNARADDRLEGRRRFPDSLLARNGTFSSFLWHKIACIHAEGCSVRRVQDLG
jgi:hypothetical protein